MITINSKDNGYRGIWYMNQPSDDEYMFKYSGGLGTYCAKHQPFAVYSHNVRKTYFCYGGTSKNDYCKLHHMVSYYDHVTGMVPRPTVLLDKNTDDAHDNPVISLDVHGYVWIFSTSHGTIRPSYIHRSRKPYDIGEFDLVPATRIVEGEPVPFTNFSYMQVWNIPKKGFVSFMTHYDDPAIRMSFFVKSPEMETSNLGTTWETADGRPLALPLTDVDNPALVFDYKTQGLNVYLKDIQFDGSANPVILYMTSKGYETGPENAPRIWTIAHWSGKKWNIMPAVQSDSNYDMGSLYIEGDGLWRIIAPTETGPQPFNPGGEVAMWSTSD